MYVIKEILKEVKKKDSKFYTLSKIVFSLVIMKTNFVSKKIERKTKK